MLLAAGWVYLATTITSGTGELLPHPFTLTIMAVYSLLHFPLGYPSHPLDGTLLCCSSDFPRSLAVTCCTKNGLYPPKLVGKVRLLTPLMRTFRLVHTLCCLPLAPLLVLLIAWFLPPDLYRHNLSSLP